MVNPAKRGVAPAKRSKRKGAALLGRRPRFNASAATFIVLLAVFCFAGVGIARSIVLAFSVAAAIFLALIAHMFSQSDTSSMRARARDEDPGRLGALSSSVGVSCVVLIALGLELHASQSGGALEIALAAICLLLSWLFMNTMFAIHYAHTFYGDDTRHRKRGGLDFPGEGEADYWDFAYFAIVIGMTFQVSDVQITDRHMRRVVLIQSIIAFFFNVIIIALSVNVVAGKA